MAELNKEEMLRVVEENIQKMENKSFNVFFFVIDTKGNPSGVYLPYSPDFEGARL